MMKWIKCSDRLPEKDGRYLIMIKCHSGMHKCLAWNYAYPCCDINFAYFCQPDYWESSTLQPITIDYIITHWMALPQKPVAEPLTSHADLSQCHEVSLVLLSSVLNVTSPYHQVL